MDFSCILCTSVINYDCWLQMGHTNRRFWGVFCTKSISWPNGQLFPIHTIHILKAIVPAVNLAIWSIWHLFRLVASFRIAKADVKSAVKAKFENHMMWDRRTKATLRVLTSYMHQYILYTPFWSIYALIGGAFPTFVLESHFDFLCLSK